MVCYHSCYQVIHIHSCTLHTFLTLQVHAIYNIHTIIAYRCISYLVHWWGNAPLVLSVLCNTYYYVMLYIIIYYIYYYSLHTHNGIMFHVIHYIHNIHIYTFYSYSFVITSLLPLLAFAVTSTFRFKAYIVSFIHSLIIQYVPFAVHCNIVPAL